MKIIGFLSTALLVLPFHFATTEEPTSGSSILTQKYFEFTLRESPENAQFLGYPVEEPLWTDFSPAGADRKTTALQELLPLIDAIRLETTHPDEFLELDILEWLAADTLTDLTFGSHYLLLNQLDGVHLLIGDTLAGSPNQTTKELELLLKRLDTIPRLIDQVIATLRAGIEKGIVPAKISTIGIPTQLRSLIPEDPRESYFYTPFLNCENEGVKEQAQKILSMKVYPALKKFLDYTISEYLPACREDIAWSSLPHGKKWYQHCVQRHTTTDLNPKEIHAIGLSEVSRIRAAMRDIIAEVGFQGNEEEFFHDLRTNPAFYHTNREELLQGYRDLIAQVEIHLPEIFGVLPKLPCEVAAVPSHSEQNAPAAYYMPGSINGRPGKFYANTYDLKSNPIWEMEALALHEALPGHHLQMTLTLEQEELSPFRKTTFFTSYCEGWALYCEGLGKELGLYKDPYSRFGRLVCESMRAVRLVVDTGIHALGWSRQQAIDYMLENTTLSPYAATAEIDRYITWPGQALAYKIGELKILELKQRARETLGDRFDIRAFHDFILLPGMLPLSILEEQFEEWLFERR